MSPQKRMTTTIAAGIVASLACATPAVAQNWSFDAREIALGGAGNGGDIGAQMIQQEDTYGTLVLPFGLLQVVPNWHVFNPGDDRFDPVRAAQYAASPIHYIVNRDDTATGQRFVSDVRNARMSRDLNVYRGFVPAATLQEAGLAAPSWGGTFKFARKSDGGFQGIFVGGGPYLSTQTSTVVDDRLRTLLASDTPVFTPLTNLRLDNTTTTQMALSVVGGYRGRFALGGLTGANSGLYVAANYRYLHGFLFEDLGLGLRLDTDATGLLVPNPAATPLAVTRRHASRGRGFALDFGAAMVVDRLQVGVGVNNVANRIDWRDADRRGYTIASLLAGDEFEESPAVDIGDLRVELPVEYRAHAAYRGAAWFGTVEVGRGIQGNTVRGGFERRFGGLALRGGARYVRERWEPRGGVGVNPTRRIGLDLTAYSTSANLQRKRQLAFATSFRFRR